MTKQKWIWTCDTVFSNERGILLTNWGIGQMVPNNGQQDLPRIWRLGVSKGLHTVVGHNYARYWAGFIAMHVPAVTRIWFGRGCPAHKYRGANNNTTWTKNFPLPLCSIKNQVKKVVTPVKTHIKPSQHWGPGDIPVQNCNSWVQSLEISRFRIQMLLERTECPESMGFKTSQLNRSGTKNSKATDVLNPFSSTTL